MKKFLIVGLIFCGFSVVSAFADHQCPDLAGSWKCKDKIVDVQQRKNQEDVWEYEIPFQGEMLLVITDGKKHQAGTKPELQDLYYKAVCSDDAVKGKIDGSYDGMEVDLDAVVSKQSGKLVTDVWGTAMGFPVSQKVSCTPN